DSGGGDVRDLPAGTGCPEPRRGRRALQANQRRPTRRDRAPLLRLIKSRACPRPAVAVASFAPSPGDRPAIRPVLPPSCVRRALTFSSPDPPGGRIVSRVRSTKRGASVWPRLNRL